MADLPAGLTVRPIRLTDDAAIARQMSAYTSKLLGFPKHSHEDVASYLRDPSLDLELDSWLVFDGSTLAGTATASRAGTGRVNLDIVAADPAVVAWLFEVAMNRARVQGRAAGDAELTVSLGTLQDDRLMAGLAKDHGLTIGTTVQRMQIRHQPPIEAPAVPDGVVVRRGGFDEDTRRAAHQVLTESFAEQPSALPRPYDEWVASREARSTFDWSQLTVLDLAGQAVAMRECNDNFVSSENCGYIGRIGVIPTARGRRLATFLLQDAFAVDSATGLSGTILHVDSSNPTPAVQLYLGVGMRPTVVSDIWRRTLATG